MKFRKMIAAMAVVGVLLAGNPAWATPKDPNLDQQVSDSETIAPAGEQTVLQTGHIDLGPIFLSENSDELALLARDDTQATPVWRQTSDVVFEVGQAAQQILPEGGAYDFTGKKSGETVWALPQTQVAGAPWLGWNTQSPKVAETFDRGVTFEFVGHQGPGQFTVFLQAGGFGEPQVLWTSTKAEVQAIWVDLLTHTHANWVFTEPGVHLVKLRVKGVAKDGRKLEADGVLRFAVGEADQALAFSTQWDSSVEPQAGSVAPSEPQALEAPKADHAAQTSAVVNKVVFGSLAVSVVLLVLIIFIWRRSQKAQQAARASSAGGA